MSTIQLQKKNGVTITFECDLSEADARGIILQAHRAHQNVGDFALKLASQQRGLTELQAGWLKYLAMEISGRLRAQFAAGPWAWLLEEPFSNDQIQIVPPPSPPSMQGLAPGPRCCWVRLRRHPQYVIAESSDREWEYVGLIDAHGGFGFSKQLQQLISGEGRSAMLTRFPEEENRLRDEAKWLQWQAIQLLEALKRHH